MSTLIDVNKYYRDTYSIVQAVGAIGNRHPQYGYGGRVLNRLKTLINLSLKAVDAPKDINDLKDLFALFPIADFETEINIDTWKRHQEGQQRITQNTPNFNIKTPSKEKVFKMYIIPLMNTWGDRNITDLDLKLIYRKWLATESNHANIITAIENIGEQLSFSEHLLTTGVNMSAEDVEYFESPNVEGLGSAFKIPSVIFFNDLLNGTNFLGDSEKTIEGALGNDKGQAKIDISYVLGFSEVLEEALGTGLGRTANTDARTIEEIEKQLKENPEQFALLVAGARGEEYKAPTAEELISLRQCALMTRLLHEDESKIRFSNYFNNGNFSNSPLQVKIVDDEPVSPGNQRIYPVDPSYDPNLFYNKCHISSASKESLVVRDSGDTLERESLNKKLFWVFEDISGNLKEVELNLSSDAGKQEDAENYYLFERARQIYLEAGRTETQQTSIVESILGESKTREEVTQKLAELNKTSFEDTNDGFYVINDIEIKYEGTNPSTARNDVQVQMSFTLSSLEALSLHMNSLAIPTDITGAEEGVFIKLYELITLPVSNKVSKGPGSYLENQYNPEYSRTRLKVYSGDGNACDLIIDLTTIDHSLSRESDTGVTTLTINYRGFFDAMMNMPFNDALADDDTIRRREELHNEAMSVIKTKDCTPELLNKALRMEQEIFRREAKSLSAASLLKRLSEKKLIYGYTVKEDQILARAVNGTLDPFQDYVSYVHPSRGGLTEDELKTIQEEMQKDKEKEETDEEDKKGIKNKFFFLGDLLYMVSGCLYNGYNTTDMRPVAKNMNMRFMIGTINVPNPKTKDGSLMIINPVCIPVDVAYFIEWFNATIVNKGITTYPVGIFMKELIERLINNIIFEVCFSSLLPSENPPIIRSTFISNYVTETKGWFKKSEKGWFNPSNPYNMVGPVIRRDTQRMTVEEINKQLADAAAFADEVGGNLFKKDALFNRAGVQPGAVADVNPYNYCVIYQQFPTFSQYTAKNSKDRLRNTDYVPTIFYGKQNTDYNYLTNVSFAKTDSPFLREARYFNSSYGNLSLLSNVYDLNFSFVRRKANTFLYPGIIINFVLMDWATSTPDSPQKIIEDNLVNKNNTDPTKDDYVALGQNNPHSPNTMAHILGFGGYYIIKSVTYKLGQSADNFEISITSKFMATDAVKKGSRKSKETPNLEDKKVCVEAYNKLHTRVSQLEGDEYYARAQVKKEENTTGTPNETRVIIQQTKQAEQTEAVTTSPTVSVTDLEKFNEVLVGSGFRPTDKGKTKGKMTGAEVDTLYSKIDALGMSESMDISGYYTKGSRVFHIEFLAGSLYVNGDPV